MTNETQYRSERHRHDTIVIEASFDIALTNVVTAKAIRGYLPLY